MLFLSPHFFNIRFCKQFLFGFVPYIACFFLMVCFIISKQTEGNNCSFLDTTEYKVLITNII